MSTIMIIFIYEKQTNDIATLPNQDGLTAQQGFDHHRVAEGRLRPVYIFFIEI